MVCRFVLKDFPFQVISSADKYFERAAVIDDYEGGG